MDIIEVFDKGFESAWSRMEKHKGVPVEQSCVSGNVCKDCKVNCMRAGKNWDGDKPRPE